MRAHGGRHARVHGDLPDCPNLVGQLNERGLSSVNGWLNERGGGCYRWLPPGSSV